MIGRSKLLHANADSPYFPPLARLVVMSFGPPLVIGEEFGTLSHVERVFIYGSWAARYAGEQGPAPHDVDVLLIGTPDRDETCGAPGSGSTRIQQATTQSPRRPATPSNVPGLRRPAAPCCYPGRLASAGKV